MTLLPDIPTTATPRDRVEAGERFNIDTFLDALAPHLVEGFRSRITGPTFYLLFTRDPRIAIPIGHCAFRDALGRFRVRIAALNEDQRRVLNSRVAALYPRTGSTSAKFTPYILPPPEPHGANGTEDSGV